MAMKSPVLGITVLIDHMRGPSTNSTYLSVLHTCANDFIHENNVKVSVYFTSQKRKTRARASENLAFVITEPPKKA